LSEVLPMATDAFDFVSALEQELEIAYEDLANLMSRPGVRPGDGSTEAVVDTLANPVKKRRSSP